MIAFPSIQIAQSSSRSTTRNMINVTYGNGYEQRAPNGINFMRDSWSISWEGLTQTDATTIAIFLNTASTGATISWLTPFDSVTKKFILDGDWSMSDSGGAIFNITCKLKQVFDLT